MPFCPSDKHVPLRYGNAMLGDIRTSATARGLLQALALLVLAVHLIAPTGFMPVRTDHGVVVTLCTGQGAINLVMPRGHVPDRGDHHPDDGMQGQQHCPFAASVQPVVPPVLAADLSLPVWQSAFGPIAFALKTGLIARLAAPPPPSSGPPAAF